MCYHVSIPGSNTIKMEFDWASVEENLEPIHHLSGFSFEKTPVITCERKDKIQFFNWGLIPGWVKDKEQAGKMQQWCLNATGENVFEKPSFKMPINKNRCLVIVDGFFEWRELKGKKYPYFIYLKNRKAFSLAGIYDQWVDKSTGEIFNTYSIVTTSANSLMEKIHNIKKRMPVILPKESEQSWLEASLEKEKIIQMMVPLEEDLMEAYTVSKQITSRNENSNFSEVKRRFDYKELEV